MERKVCFNRALLCLIDVATVTTALYCSMPFSHQEVSFDAVTMRGSHGVSSPSFLFFILCYSYWAPDGADAERKLKMINK